jgi:RHS repeat-associated protein
MICDRWHGRDLSGSLEGAGGIGGLLAIQDANGTTTGENHESDDLRYVYFYDANGNVGQVIDLAASSASASIKAHYEYDAYGKILVQSGSYAAANPYRFSTKPWDDETGLGYWGERYYDPRLGRWINHDPIGELGGKNLYRYASNAPVNRIDARGTVDRPGCTGVPDFLENACRLECCAQHDYCFDVHNCSALTWLIPWPPECVACNLAVVGCFLDCLLHPDRDDPNRWNYYCSCHNVWFNDPSDPHMKHSSDDPDCVKTPPGPRPPPPGSGGAGCPTSS